MPVYWRQYLDGLGHHVAPSVETTNPMQPMRAGPVESVIRGQDYVGAMSRRIVAAGGIDGSVDWLTPDTDPTATAGTHQSPTERRRIAAGSFELTPGCFLRCWASAIPSGETQVPMVGILMAAGGASGSIEIDVTWTDDTGSESTTHSIELPGSTEEFGAEPASMWQAIRRFQLVIEPPDIDEIANLRRWSRHTHVDVEVFAVGGARVISACVAEDPHSIALEADDTVWCSHLLAPDDPGEVASPISHPFQRFSETSPDGDPRGGTRHLADVHHAQHERLGAMIFSWSAYNEASGSESMAPGSLTWVAIQNPGQTTWDADEPALPGGTGGYSRRVEDNDVYALGDVVASVPVIVRVLAVNSAGVANVRVQTTAVSMIDMTLTNGDEQWHSAAGYLEVGITPDQMVAPQIFARHSTGATFNIAAVQVYYAGGYTPPA